MIPRIRRLLPFNKPNSPRLNSRGVALLQALFLVLLITFIVNQVNFEASVDYTVNSQALHRVKAYQAARAGVELSLLRIKLYEKALEQFGDQLGDQAQMLNMIYQLPVSWPMVLPAEMLSMDKEAIDKITNESLMDATFSTMIQSEDLLNINDLGAPTEAQQTRVRNKLEDLFKARIQNDRDFADKYRGFPFEEVINHIADWIDPDTESRNGGDERSYYGHIRNLDPDQQDSFPPNRHFRTMDEVRMVPGVTDEIFELISPAFSVFGPMGINPNLADSAALQALHHSINEDIVAKIMSRRNNVNEGGPFRDASDFFTYVNREGGRILPEDEERIPLRFTNPCNFRIQSTGASGKTVLSITAVTYNLSCVQSAISSDLAAERKRKGTDTSPDDRSGPSSSQTKGGSSRKQELPKGPPRIVYWLER